jgi:hypothetical protein
MGIGSFAGWLSGIFSPLTMNVIQLFSPLVKGLKIAIPQGPSWRDSIEVGELLKILLAEPEVGGSIHLGGPTDKVVTTRLKRLVVFIKPSVF